MIDLGKVQVHVKCWVDQS